MANRGTRVFQAALVAVDRMESQVKRFVAKTFVFCPTEVTVFNPHRAIVDQLAATVPTVLRA